MNVIFWDTETNGLKEYHSVLSISAIKYSFIIEGQNIESNKIEQYERFYFRKPDEKIGEEAIAVNGLTDEVISKRRNGVDYPEHFHNDIMPFRKFCTDTMHFVGHNIYYDKQYINFWLPNMFCTMISNTKIIGLKKKTESQNTLHCKKRRDFMVLRLIKKNCMEVCMILMLHT
jgi:DNA polymerase-3 subunit epsilon